MRLNPLTSIVEQSRTVIVFGGMPDFVSLGLYTLCALTALAFAFWLFQRLRPGFADVL
jgi:lipopolysaccharide transport system permease protein